MDFTIITTIFNDERNIVKYLNDFERQSLRPTEMLIVDGGSKDDTVQHLHEIKSRYSYPIRIISNCGRLNIPQGYNIAVQQCYTEVMIITGIGNHYPESFCESMMSFYRQEKCEIIYTPIIGNDKTAFAKAFNIAFVGGKRGVDFGQASNRGVLITKAVFHKIGYFYEDFIYAGEDTEFFIRAHQRGVISRFNRKIFVLWETPATFAEYLKKSRFNAIADLQCFGYTKILKHIIIRLVLLIGGTIIFVLNPLWTIVLMGLLVCVIAMKIRSISVWAILLRVHFIFLPSYYYIKYNKYLKSEYSAKNIVL